MMLVNGLPQQFVSLDERALNYGDGVFETIRLHKGKAILFDQHMQRLFRSCERLGLHCDFEALVREIDSLRPHFSEHGILKIIISRGQGGRGYRAQTDMLASRLLSLHPFPDYADVDQTQGVKVFICHHQMSEQKQLGGIKHLNRLDQVMAAQEWPDESYFEGLVGDQKAHIIEGTRSNLFFSEAGILYTPEIEHCGVAGVLRAYLLDKFGTEIVLCRELKLSRLLQADEVFLCNSVIGVWPVNLLVHQDEQQQYPPGPFATKARALFDALLESDAAP
jgi:4-amino-4-deoxychorismate lyase